MLMKQYWEMCICIRLPVSGDGFMHVAWVYINICVEKRREFIETGARHTNTQTRFYIYTQTTWERTDKARFRCCGCNRYSRQHTAHIHGTVCATLFRPVCVYWHIKRSFLLLLMDCAWKSILLPIWRYCAHWIISNWATPLRCLLLVCLPSLCLLCAYECVRAYVLVCMSVWLSEYVKMWECVFVFFLVYRIAGDSGVCASKL